MHYLNHFADGHGHGIFQKLIMHQTFICLSCPNCPNNVGEIMEMDVYHRFICMQLVCLLYVSACMYMVNMVLKCVKLSLDACRRTCKNGGKCVAHNKCSCLTVFSGKWCQKGNFSFVI